MGRIIEVNNATKRTLQVKHQTASARHFITTKNTPSRLVVNSNNILLGSNMGEATVAALMAARLVAGNDHIAADILGNAYEMAVREQAVSMPFASLHNASAAPNFNLSIPRRLNHPTPFYQPNTPASEYYQPTTPSPDYYQPTVGAANFSSSATAAPSLYHRASALPNFYDYQITSGKPRNPDYMSSSRNSDYKSSFRSPHNISSSKNPDYMSSSKNPDYMSSSRSPDYMSSSRNPDYLASSLTDSLTIQRFDESDRTHFPRFSDGGSLSSLSRSGNSSVSQLTPERPMFPPERSNIAPERSTFPLEGSTLPPRIATNPPSNEMSARSQVTPASLSPGLQRLDELMNQTQRLHINNNHQAPTKFGSTLGSFDSYNLSGNNDFKS